MKRIVPFLVVSACLAFHGEMRADDRLRDVQTELKAQGFYYGEINGDLSSETSAALRRYQIRNGLEVTGTLSDETAKSLGIGAIPGTRIPQAPPSGPATPPSADLQKEQSLAASDRDFLRRQDARERVPEADTPLEDDPSMVAPPRPLELPTADLPVLFADTPYATAPREVQESTLRRAQRLLAGRGMYREAIDGIAGPATEEAILSYQRSVRLPLTGRLDLETLSRMDLLPPRGAAPQKGFVRRPVDPIEPQGVRIFRGIWIR